MIVVEEGRYDGTQQIDRSDGKSSQEDMEWRRGQSPPVKSVTIGIRTKVPYTSVQAF